MTTAGSDVPASRPAKAASALPLLRHAQAAPDADQRLSRLWLLTPLAVIAAGLAAWAGWHRLTAPASVGDTRLHEIRRRSFPIVLKEKGELKAHKSVDIKCEVEGGSTIIWLVPEGTTVKKGDLLVELASDTIDQKIREKKVTVSSAENTFATASAELDIQVNKNLSDIAKATTALELAEIDLKKWEEGDWFQQLQAAKLDLKTAQSQYKQAQEQLKVSERMYTQQFVTAVDLESDQLAAEAADFKLRKAQKALEVLEQYTYVKDKKTYESAVRDAKENLERTKAMAEVEESKARGTAKRREEQLALARAELAKYEDQLTKTKIHAPQPGLVVYHSDRYRRSNTMVDVGAKVHQNQKIIELPDLSQMKLVIRVHEADAERIKVGLPAKIQVAGVYEEVTEGEGNGTRASGAQKIFDGEITKIAALADTRNRWLNPELREFETEITLAEASDTLKPGVTAEAEIYVDHIEDAVAVPVQAVYARGGHSYVFLGNDGGRPEFREVRLGAASTSFVQVLSGVAVGDRVWTTITDEMIALLPSVDEEGLAAERELDAARRALGTGRRPRQATPAQGSGKPKPHGPKKPGTPKPPKAATGAK